MEHCGIGGFSSATEVAGMAGFMTAVGLMIIAGLLGAFWLGGKSMYEIGMGAHGINWLWLALALVGILLTISLGMLAIPQTLCLWGAV